MWDDGSMKRLAIVVAGAVVAAALAWGTSRHGADPAVSAAAPASPSPSPQASAEGRLVVPLTLPSGKVLQTEVMIKDADREMGLMFRPSLPLDHGMLFLFEQPGMPGIWMKNCKFPIDILWLDEQRRVVHLEEAVPPCKAEPCPVYQPLRQASYVLEINARQARREKALVGSVLAFTLPQ
jgi:uncharacterized membrane protein (UPF0127 family)